LAGAGGFEPPNGGIKNRLPPLSEHAFSPDCGEKRKLLHQRLTPEFPTELSRAPPCDRRPGRSQSFAKPMPDARRYTDVSRCLLLTQSGHQPLRITAVQRDSQTSHSKAFARDLVSAPCYNSVIITGANNHGCSSSLRKYLNGLCIVSAVILVILISVAPHQASAKGGIKSCCFTTRAEAAPITSSRSEPTAETFGVGCGGKRSRDPITHRCRGPADFGH